MKKLPFNRSIWSLVLLLSAGSLAACAQTATGTGTAATNTANDPAKATLLTPLQQSVNKLKKLASTGDPDFDYAFQAKVHTQGIQDLLKQEIQNGKDTALVCMAKAMLPTASSDVSMLDNTIMQIKPTRPNQAFSQQQSRNIEAINLKLQQTGSSDKLTSNLDKNFSTLLLDQRQDAIDLATTYLQYGKNDALRTYAQQMIDKAKVEMTRVKAMPK